MHGWGTLPPLPSIHLYPQLKPLYSPYEYMYRFRFRWNLCLARSDEIAAAAADGCTDGVRLAFTRYCHHQYCMVYGIRKGYR